MRRNSISKRNKSTTKEVNYGTSTEHREGFLTDDHHHYHHWKSGNLENRGIGLIWQESLLASIQPLQFMLKNMFCLEGSRD